MRTLTATICLTISVLLGSAGVTLGETIELKKRFNCKEISAKSFSVHGEITNVVMDGEGLDVNVLGSFMTTKYPSLGSKTRFENVVSLRHKDRNGNEIINSQFVAKHGGMFGTKTVTITYQESTGNWFMISTEPFALGKDYPAIRTHFHKCFPKD
jgi:hypothetical protein